MKLKLILRTRSASACAALMFAVMLSSVSSVSAQEEGAPQVIDEVIAQVNTEVITLSMLKRELSEAREGLKQTRNLTDAQASEEIAKRQPEIIATLINEQLLLQKGKEMGLSEDVEAEVNKRMLAVAKEQNIKTLAALEQAMRENGIDPASIRQTLRAEVMKTWVLGREVDQRIFLGLTETEVKSYYEANKEKFRKPETIVLSEIYLSLVGKDPKEVRDRADKLVAQLRAGGDFGALAMVESEREVNGKRIAPESRGKLGNFAVSDISREDVANAVKNVKAGGVTDPIVTEQGILILRIDERTPAGESAFEDNKVREAITVTRLDKERKSYIENLRTEAYVEIAPSYREAVLPFLKTETAANSGATPPVTNAPRKKEDKKENKKENKKEDKKKSEANAHKKQ